MNDKENSDSGGSLKTTKTMRQKAQAVGRCFLNMLKLWRLCCRKKKTKEVSK